MWIIIDYNSYVRDFILSQYQLSRMRLYCFKGRLQLQFFVRFTSNEWISLNSFLTSKFSLIFQRRKFQHFLVRSSGNFIIFKLKSTCLIQGFLSCFIRSLDKYIISVDLHTFYTNDVGCTGYRIFLTDAADAHNAGEKFMNIQLNAQPPLFV